MKKFEEKCLLDKQTKLFNLHKEELPVQNENFFIYYFNFIKLIGSSLNKLKSMDTLVNSMCGHSDVQFSIRFFRINFPLISRLIFIKNQP